MGSDTLVSGGVPTSMYSTVMQIKIITTTRKENCTSFVVSSNTLLTAAHCLINASEVYVLKKKDWIKAKGFSYNKKFNINDFKTFIYDVGVVVFEDDTFSDIHNYLIINHGETVSTHTMIRLVGFGCKTRISIGEVEFTDEKSKEKQANAPRLKCSYDKLEKRTGSSHLSENKVCTNGMYESVALNLKPDTEKTHPDGRKGVYLFMGDSGGPLLSGQDEQKVIDIASCINGPSSPNVYSCFSNPSSKENLEYLSTAINELHAIIPNVVSKKSKSNGL